MNSEAKEKLKSGEYDPLIRAPRRCYLFIYLFLYVNYFKIICKLL